MPKPNPLLDDGSLRDLVNLLEARAIAAYHLRDEALLVAHYDTDACRVDRALSRQGNP